jgi:hypothetical protein
MAYTISAPNGVADTLAPTELHAAAVHAAQEIVRRHGLAAGQARVLQDTNNVVVHLAPSPVVAKICRASVGDHGWQRLATELEIARHLECAGAPVVGPSQELPPGPHVHGGFAMTFWRYQDHDPSAPVSAGAAEHVLAQVHGALDGYPESFPSFLDRQVRRASRILFDETTPSSIPTTERAFLCSQYLRISSMLRDTKFESRTLHGDPHRGNLLASRTGYVLIDFESVCSGPLEWDLSALPGVGSGTFSVNADLLSLLRKLRSLCVAVWCMTRSKSSIALDHAARMHLGLLTLAAQSERA